MDGCGPLLGKNVTFGLAITSHDIAFKFMAGWLASDQQTYGIKATNPSVIVVLCVCVCVCAFLDVLDCTVPW